MTRQLLIALAFATTMAQADYTPATLTSADVPNVPPQIVGGGEVLAELTVSTAGSVTGVTPIRSTPPFTDLVVEAARGWSFSPAEAPDEAGTVGPVESKVLAVALFRPPTVYAGPSRGETPREVGVASPAVPYISALGRPAYPSGALFNDVVLLALQVTAAGAVADATVVRSGGIFDRGALETARGWRFQPASRAGTAVPATVVAMIGFFQPITPE